MFPIWHKSLFLAMHKLWRNRPNRWHIRFKGHFSSFTFPLENILRLSATGFIQAKCGSKPLNRNWTDFFSHIARSAPDEDHHRAVATAICKPPEDRKQPPGRPNHTWLRAIEPDLKPLNIGPSYVWKKAASREHWRSTVDTATLKKSKPRREWEKWLLCHTANSGRTLEQTQSTDRYTARQQPWASCSHPHVSVTKHYTMPAAKAKQGSYFVTVFALNLLCMSLSLVHLTINF